MLNLLTEETSGFSFGLTIIVAVVMLVTMVFSAFYRARQRGEGLISVVISIVLPFVTAILIAGGGFLITAAGWQLPDWTRIAGICAIVVGVLGIIFYIRRNR